MKKAVQMQVHHDPKTILEDSVDHYFLKAITDQLLLQEISLHTHTKSYLVTLLTQFTQTSVLYPSKEPESLAILYLQSQQAGQEERIQRLKRLGDLALCIAGLWADSLKRKVVDVDYYINMGQGAYGSLSDIFEKQDKHKKNQTIYQELTHKFSLIVELFNIISEGSLTQDKSTLRLYDRWVKTGSERIYKTLCNQGIIPIKVDKKSWQ